MISILRDQSNLLTGSKGKRNVHEIISARQTSFNKKKLIVCSYRDHFGAKHNYVLPCVGIFYNDTPFRK